MVLLAFLMCISWLCVPVKADAATKLPNKVYKNVKGKWYTQSSSSGYNIKFTKTRVKYYDRSTNKLVYNCKIIKVTKIKKGYYKGEYKIVYKGPFGKNCYKTVNKGKKGFDYFYLYNGKWQYSGSSSLFKGKWKV